MIAMGNKNKQIKFDCNQNLHCALYTQFPWFTLFFLMLERLTTDNLFINGKETILNKIRSLQKKIKTSWRTW